MTERVQIKFDCIQGNTRIAAEKLARYFSLAKVNYHDYFLPGTPATRFVYIFANEADREKATSLPDFAEKLQSYHTQLYTPRDSSDCSHRMAFIYGLNSNYFYCKTAEDGVDPPETLDQKKEQLIEALKDILGDDLEDHHFHERKDRAGRIVPPRTMTITLPTFEKTEEFINENTLFAYGILRADQKKFHRNIPIIQCSV